MLLRETDVDMSLYGKFDITGVKDGEPEPCPRVWDPLRHCWSDDWKENLYDFEAKELNQIYDDMSYRCADKLPDPKKLYEIA
jgi:small subunit ribosomal protein S29